MQQIAADLTFITSNVGVMNGADWWCEGLAKHGVYLELNQSFGSASVRLKDTESYICSFK